MFWTGGIRESLITWLGHDHLPQTWLDLEVCHRRGGRQDGEDVNVRWIVAAAAAAAAEL